jgi:hypothetical protein
LTGRIRQAEKGLLWGLVHDPGGVLPWLKTLEDQDLEGLSTAGILRAARALSLEGGGEAPNALIGRLTSTEAQWLAATAAESLPPVLNAELSVKSLKRLRFERERAEIQQEIHRLQSEGNQGSALMELLLRKQELVRRLDEEDG